MDAGGLFAIYVPAAVTENSAVVMAAMRTPPFDLPVPPVMEAYKALPVAMARAGHFYWMARASKGAFRACFTVTEIRPALAEGVIAGVQHMEGAEAIGADLAHCTCFMRWVCGRWGRSGHARRSLAMACRSAFPQGPTPGRG